MAEASSSDLTAAAEAAAASGFPAVRLERTGKIYGSGPTAVTALRDAVLEVWPGEFVVLLGPSGSGKTTLLNLIGGIEEPTSGRIMVAGTDIASLHGIERTAYRRDRVGFVFQFFNLVPTLTALENVEIMADLFMSRYETQGFHWNLDMHATTPIVVAVAVLATALLAQVPALRVIRQMDVAKVVRERSL